MALSTKVDGLWKSMAGVYVNVLGTWKTVSYIHAKVGGAWKEVYALAGGNDDYTVLLIHADGANGSTVFTDSSHIGRVITTQGNAQVTTGQSKFGGASMALDGVGDDVYCADSADFDYGSGDFTIDFWARHTALPGLSGATFYWDRGGDDLYIYNDSGTYKVYCDFGGITQMIGNVTMTTNTWYHWAVVRNGSSFNVYQDGVSVASTTDADTITDITASLYIGIQRTGSYALEGQMDEFRISKGIARWTANFTPPTAAYGGGPPSSIPFRGMFKGMWRRTGRLFTL